MGKHTPTTIIALALALLALAGCGTTKTTASNNTSGSQTASSPSATQPTTPAASQPTTAPATTTASTPSKPAPVEHSLVVEKVELSSPAFQPQGEIPARYTCDGQDTPPPLRWGGIPSGTHELLLEILGYKPVNDKLYFNWAITNIQPETTGTQPNGAPPPHAVTARNSAGHTSYTICPPKGTTEKYLAVLYALPHPLPAQQGFDPAAQRLKAQQDADYSAHLNFSYTRH